MLPAALGIAAWERGIVPRRALAAGALIGVGAAIKTVPGLLLLAVLPRSASRREAAVAAGAAVAVPFLLLVPFALATPDAIDIVARYHGAPGLGSLSLVVQPDLPSGWFGQRLVERSALTDGLQDLRTPIVLAALGTLGLWLARVRPAPFVAAAMVWLTFYVFGVNFFLQYAVWGLVFLILAGELPMAVVLQALVLAPLLVTYAHVRGARAVDVLYSVPMLAFWGASLTMLVMLGARGLRRDRTDFVPIR
jgi:hypothetical protein